MYKIPLEPTPWQELLVTLEDQNCTITLFQRGERMYMDVVLDDEEIASGTVCLPRVPLIQCATDIFVGNFFFTDERSEPARQQPPQWDGLGTRYQLYYVTAEELDTLDAERAARALEEANA